MIGIDEVGRGCWAGPLLIVAARQKTDLPVGLDDSKKLTKKKRELLFVRIKQSCDLGEGWVTAQEIDAIGLTGAMKLGVDRALKNIDAKFDEQIIMDGLINYCNPKYIDVQCEAKADGKYPVVSAASVYAKVTRDNFMAQLGEKYKKYEFEKHVGYGTQLHSGLLKKHGVSDQHRLSFKPIAQRVKM